MAEQIRILDVTPGHGPVIAARFPEARDAKLQPTLYAALGRDDEVLGLALLVTPAWSEAPACRFALDVPPHADAVRIEALLTDHVVATATRHRFPALRNLRPPATPEAAARLEALGFRVLRQTVTHTFALRPALAEFDAVVGRLRDTGKIPAGIAALPYRDGPSREISSLCRAEFGALTHGHLVAQGEHPPDGVDASFARSFWLDGRLVGAWGVVVEHGVATFDPLLVARGWRDTWAFSLIVHSVLQALVSHGVERGRAQVHADNRKVMAVMRRVGARPVSTETLYERQLVRAADVGGAP